MLPYVFAALLVPPLGALAAPKLDPNDFDWITPYPTTESYPSLEPGLPYYITNTETTETDGKTMTVFPMIGTVWYSDPWTSTALTVKEVAAPLTTDHGVPFAKNQPDPSRHPDFTFNIGADMVKDTTVTPSTTYWVTTARMYKNATFTGAVRNTPCSTCETAWKSVDTVNTSPTVTESRVITWTSERIVRMTTVPLTATDWMLVTITTDEAKWTAMVEVTKLPFATMSAYKNLQIPPLFEPVLPKDDGHGFYKMTQLPTKVAWPEANPMFPETEGPIIRDSTTIWPSTSRRIVPINEDAPTPVPRTTYSVVKRDTTMRITASPAYSVVQRAK